MKTTLLALLILIAPLPCSAQIGISNQRKISVHIELASSKEDSTYTKQLFISTQSAVDGLHRAAIAKSMEQSEIAFVLDVVGVRVNEHLTGYSVAVTALENDKSTQYYKYIDTHVLASGVNTEASVAKEISGFVYDVLQGR